MFSDISQKLLSGIKNVCTIHLLWRFGEVDYKHSSDISSYSDMEH